MEPQSPQPFGNLELGLGFALFCLFLLLAIGFKRAAASGEEGALALRTFLEVGKLLKLALKEILGMAWHIVWTVLLAAAIFWVIKLIRS